MWSLNNKHIIEEKTPRFGFNGFGEVTYYRTYSRIKPDGTQETWNDTELRVIEGVMDIRLTHCRIHQLPWDEEAMQVLALKMALMLFDMKWMPPGRGLWAMGTSFVQERGAAALNNCGAVDTAELDKAVDWAMDMLMCGVGIGYNLNWDGRVVLPRDATEAYTIPDSREGWVTSVRKLIRVYTHGDPVPVFDYSEIRLEGEPIRGFGGTASGPTPLIQLHERIQTYMQRRLKGTHSASRTVSDVFNAVGACVVAGNVRRSALINLGSPEDTEFLDLKDYTKNPDRADIGWMSNNTAVFETVDDFNHLPSIADRILNNGEPGICNLLNVQSYGRYGEESEDAAWLANPCSEIPLESYELCNLVEVFPTKCDSYEEYYDALYYATIYASTVSLLPTHREETNEVIARNRRIGVSLSGLADWLDTIGATKLTSMLRDGYSLVKDTNVEFNSQAGVPSAIRCTTVKPSGTISQLAGVSSGMHFPTFRYAIRRIRVGNQSPVCDVLKKSGVPYEADVVSQNTTVFEFPIDQGTTRAAYQVSAWEQFAFLAMLQREWSDNMVSCTIYFDKEREGGQVEHMLAQFAPVIKSVSMLPHSDNGAYKQMPYEGITQEEYEERKKNMKGIDWASFVGDGRGEKFCNTDTCGL